MSELNFPKNPAVGQEYTFNSLLYMFDGVKWVTKGTGYNPVQDLYKMYASNAGASFVGVHGYDNVQAALEDLSADVTSLENVDADLQAQVNTKINADFVSRFDREALRRSYVDAGYNLVIGSFEAGGTLTTATDVLLYEADGFAYNWGGVLPKVVPAASSPAATGGVWPNGWLDVSAASLREYLAATGGSSLVSAAKSIVAPGNIAKFGDTTGIATLSIPDEKDQRLLVIKNATKASDYGTVHVIRRADYTSGSPGFVGSALNVKTEARGVGSGQSEWAGLFTMESRSTQSGEWPQNVGVYSQGLKYTSSSTWAGCFEISDRNPISGASGGAIGIEVSASANGADILATPQRNGVHIAISRGTINAQDCEWGRGFWVTAGPSARWIYGFSAENAGSYAYHAKFTGIAADSALIRDESNCAVGVDLKRASYSTQTALWFKALDKIVWESSGLISTRWNSVNNRWELRNGDDVKFWVDTTTGQTSAGGSTQALRYLSAKLSSPQTIATGSDNVVQYNSVGRNTTGGLITLDNGVLSVSPSVAEFEVVACVQCVSPDSGITLRMNFNAFANDGIYYPNPRHSHRALNPCAHISTGVIYNPPTGNTRVMYAVLDISTNPVQVEASGASAIMVRVLSTR